MDDVMTDNSEKEIDAVIYTDGSARPQNGYGGWGLHAITIAERTPYYVADLLVEGHAIHNKLAFDAVYLSKTVTDKTWIRADGSESLDLPKLTHYKPENFIDRWAGIKFPSTNNYAELMAALKAMSLIKEKNWSNVIILTDSRYVLQGINKFEKVEDTSVFKNADGVYIPNGALWVEVFQAYKDLVESKIFMEWKWVRGHNGIDGNEAADAAAKRGRAMSTNEVLDKEIQNEAKAADYGKQPKDKCLGDLIQKHWYFLPNAALSIQDRPMYFFGDHGKEDDLMGKPRSESRLSVVCLKEPEPVLEAVMERLKTNENASQFVHVGKVDLLMGPKIREEIKLNATDYFYWDDKSNSLNYYNDRTMVTVKNPALKAYRAYNALGNLAGMLKVLMSESKSDMLRVDITDKLFSKNEKGKLIVDPLLGSVNKSIRTTIPTIDKEVTLTVGIDLPTRNGLARLAGENPTVELVWYPLGKLTGRYLTYVKGDYSDSIWSAYQSNLTIS